MNILLVDVLDVVVLVVVVDVLVAELEVVLHSSQQSMLIRESYLTCRASTCCTYSKKIIITEFKFKGYFTG